LLHDLLTLFHEADNGIAGLALRLLANHVENFFESFYLALGFRRDASRTPPVDLPSAQRLRTPPELRRPTGSRRLWRSARNSGNSVRLAAVVVEHGLLQERPMSWWWSPLQETANQWLEHKDARLGAALAYYSIFSLGPLIVIAIAIAGFVFGAETVPDAGGRCPTWLARGQWRASHRRDAQRSQQAARGKSLPP
jgi:hypothetical protein